MHTRILQITRHVTPLQRSPPSAKRKPGMAERIARWSRRVASLISAQFSIPKGLAQPRCAIDALYSIHSMQKHTEQPCPAKIDQLIKSRVTASPSSLPTSSIPEDWKETSKLSTYYAETCIYRTLATQETNTRKTSPDSISPPKSWYIVQTGRANFPLWHDFNLKFPPFPAGWVEHAKHVGNFDSSAGSCLASLIHHHGKTA